MEPIFHDIKSLNNSVHIISGKPMGFDEAWFIGDTHLISMIRKTFEELKEADGFDRMGRQNLLYIIQQFEVFMGSCHYSWSFTTQIKGGLADLLSSKWKLPNYIYILFSNDQITESEVLGDEMYKVLENLFTFVTRAILNRKAELPKKAKRSNPPIITVVKTVAKSNDQLSVDNFKNKRRNLNRALQKVASNFKWRSINIDAILPDAKELFDDNGNELSNLGLKAFWKYISEDIKILHEKTTANSVQK